MIELSFNSKNSITSPYQIIIVIYQYYKGKFDSKGINFASFASKGSNLCLSLKGSNFEVCPLLKMFG